VIEKFGTAGLEIVRLWTFGFPTVNLIQPARAWYYGWRNRHPAHDKQTATERSGVDRPRLLRLIRWLVIGGMLPLLPIERRYWNSEKGDGFLILARKSS